LEQFNAARQELAELTIKHRGRESQAALATRAGIGTRTIQRIEAGQGDPALASIAALGTALGFTVAFKSTGSEK